METKASIITGNANQQTHHYYSQFSLGFDAPNQKSQMNDKQISVLSDIQQRIIQQNKEMDIINSQKIQQKLISGQTKNYENGEINSKLTNLHFRNISENRKPDRDTGLRAAGEQAILRGSSTSNKFSQNQLTALNEKSNINIQNVKSNQEDIFNLAKQNDQMNLRNSFELKPIDEYKGKSLQELEAILDAHNNHQKQKKEEQFKIDKKENIQNKNEIQEKRPRNLSRSSAKRQQEEKKTSNIPNRFSSSGTRAKQAINLPPIVPQKRSDVTEIEGQRKGFGKIPKYLQKFQKEKEDIAKEKEILKEQKKYPPGTRKMSEEERLQMIAELKKTKEFLQSELMKFPISMKTIAIQKKKEDIEQQLEKIEVSLKKFSKDVVFIEI